LKTESVVDLTGHVVLSVTEEFAAGVAETYWGQGQLNATLIPGDMATQVFHRSPFKSLR
jgi:hypothetical protein